MNDYKARNHCKYCLNFSHKKEGKNIFPSQKHFYSHDYMIHRILPSAIATSTFCRYWNVEILNTTWNGCFVFVIILDLPANQILYLVTTALAYTHGWLDSLEMVKSILLGSYCNGDWVCYFLLLFWLNISYIKNGETCRLSFNSSGKQKVWFLARNFLVFSCQRFRKSFWYFPTSSPYFNSWQRAASNLIKTDGIEAFFFFCFKTRNRLNIYVVAFWWNNILNLNLI